jgi:hypothetical protein
VVDIQQEKRVYRIEARKLRQKEAEERKRQEDERIMKLRLGYQDSRIKFLEKIKPLDKNAS